MNKEFRQLVNISYSNSTNLTQELKFRFLKPDILKSQLDSKKLRIQKFTVNNRYVPIFIPTRMVKNDNYLYNLSIGPGVNTRIGIAPGNVVSSSSLKYWIIIRAKDNSATGIVFINHVPEKPNLPTPPIPIEDDFQYYTNEYYWYHDMTHFLTILQSAISNLALGMSIIGSNIPEPQFEIDSTGGGYNFYVTAPFADNYDLEFNKELLDIFPFKNYISPNASSQLESSVIVFSPIVQGINNQDFRSTSCLFYESTFPFSQLLIKSEDININSTQFITDLTVLSNTQPQNLNAIMLEFNIRTKQYNEIYDFWTYVNNNDSLWNNFDLENSSPSSHVTISFELRLRNGLVIPLKLLPKDLLTLTFEIKYEL